MITLPDFKKSFEYENDFYLSCSTQRLGKFIAHYELYKMAMGLPGAIVECGLFKGVSFTRFATFRELFSNKDAQKMIGFDMFGEFPETEFEGDKALREKFVNDAGDQGIDPSQLREVLEHKKLNFSIELIEGDINKTVPEYVKNHPELRIALLNIDTDIYEPAKTIMEYLYPLVVRGGVVVLDDYGVFPGETKAVDDYFTNSMEEVVIEKFAFTSTPCYFIKP